MWTVGVISALVTGAVFSAIWSKRSASATVAQAEKRASDLLETQRRRARTLIEQARAENQTTIESAREAQVSAANDQAQEFAILDGTLNAREEILRERESRLAKWQNALTERDEAVTVRESAAAALATRVDELGERRNKALADRAGTTVRKLVDEQVQELVERYSHDIRREVRDDLEWVKAEAEREARHIIDIAVQRYASRYIIPKPNYALDLVVETGGRDAVKKNAGMLVKHAQARGVELSITDEEDKLVVSSLDFIQREIIRAALVKWLDAKVFTEAHLEKQLKIAESDLNEMCRTAADEARKLLNLDAIPDKIRECVGHLRYRTSYTQNQWSHGLEVAFLTGILAAELGIDQKKARRAGLFHDIGKTLDHKIEAPHAVIGATIAREVGETEELANAVGAHHNDEPPRSLLAYMVIGGDSISGGRPGARFEKAENFVDRVRELENIPMKYDGVNKVYALQAGRELRVFVDPRRVTDAQCIKLSQQIARQIETELTYPGQIQVLVIRETQAQGVAA
jgi:ribonucrease Y